MAGNTLNFDGDALKLFQGFWDNMYDHQEKLNNQCERDYLLFHAFVDMTNRDMNMANVSIPKMYNIINTKAPGEVKAILGTRPFIPLRSVREDYREQTKLSENLLDFYMHKGNFSTQFTLADIMNILYGWAYIEPVPCVEKITEKVLVEQVVDTIDGVVPVGWKAERRIVERFRIKFRARAPWEVMVDRTATGLETRDGCRGLIKIDIVSKREIIKKALDGDYGKGFDVDKLIQEKYSSYEPNKNRGAQILSTMGLPEFEPDGDLGILFRFESPDRYIDIWNDMLVLRDEPNPYAVEKGGHGLINLVRLVHNIDPHTQASFRGNGEAKINEPLANLLNDLYNMALNNHAMKGQGKTYFAKNRGVSPEQLVHAIGNKIGFEVKEGEDIRRLVYDDYGESLPADHYNLLSITERNMDLTAKSNPVSRGESEEGSQTLGEVGFLKSADEAGIELNVRILENITLSDIADKCLAHIEQFTRDEDIVEVLGREKADILLFKNPHDLPGGFNKEFKGSDRIVNQVVRQRNLGNLRGITGDDPYIKIHEFDKVLFEAYELDDVIDRVFMTEEEFAFNQQQAELKALAMSGGKPLDSKKFDLRNTDIAQERGRIGA